MQVVAVNSESLTAAAYIKPQPVTVGKLCTRRHLWRCNYKVFGGMIMKTVMRFSTGRLKYNEAENFYYFMKKGARSKAYYISERDICVYVKNAG